MSGDLTELTRRLSPGAVVTDDAVIEGYRRDRAATVAAGQHQAIKTALHPGGILNPGRSF